MYSGFARTLETNMFGHMLCLSATIGPQSWPIMRFPLFSMRIFSRGIEDRSNLTSESSSTWRNVWENISRLVHWWFIPELWRHKVWPSIYQVCDVIILGWVISGKVWTYFLEHFFTSMMTSKSDLTYLRPFSRKFTLKKVTISWWVNFVVQLWRIDITYAQTFQSQRCGQTHCTW